MTAAVKRKPAFRLQSPVVPEHSIQRQIADVLRIEIGPPGKVSKAGVVWWSCDAADYGGAVPGIRIGRGLIAGVPDMFFLYRGLGFFIELKSDVGEMSLAQRSVATALMFAGGLVGVARSAAEVVAALDTWGIPRNHRIGEFAA